MYRQHFKLIEIFALEPNVFLFKLLVEVFTHFKLFRSLSLELFGECLVDKGLFKKIIRVPCVLDIDDCINVVF